jgi:hypothetical protein
MENGSPGSPSTSRPFRPYRIRSRAAVTAIRGTSHSVEPARGSICGVRRMETASRPSTDRSTSISSTSSGNGDQRISTGVPGTRVSPAPGQRTRPPSEPLARSGNQQRRATTAAETSRRRGLRSSGRPERPSPVNRLFRIPVLFRDEMTTEMLSGPARPRAQGVLDARLQASEGIGGVRHSASTIEERGEALMLRRRPAARRPEAEEPVAGAAMSWVCRRYPPISPPVPSKAGPASRPWSSPRGPP